MKAQALFRLDLNRCTGCSACAVACSIENDLAEGMTWRRIHTYNARRHPQAATYHLSLACNHCVDPACMRGCPAAAYKKDPHTGVVLLNQEHCIGCGYCAWVCPYDAPQMNPKTGVMEKCTFCSPRLAKGLEPACVQACPVDALGFDPDGEPVAQDVLGFPETGLLPAISLTPKRGSAPRAEVTEIDDNPDKLEGCHVPSVLYRRFVAFVVERLASLARRVADGIPLVFLESPTTPAASRAGEKCDEPPVQDTSVPEENVPRLDLGRLRSDWPLLAFSLILTGMVVWFASALAAGTEVHGPGFALTGLAAMAVSTLHLGRPTRAWRAVLNVRTSWVSREILLFSAFWVTASATALAPLPVFATWLAAALGFTALVCVDLVYRVPGQRYDAVPHSAMTSLTALYMLGLALAVPWLALAAGVAKLALYPWQRAAAGEIPYAMTLTRFGLGLAWPLVLWLAQPSPDPLLLLSGPAIAEIVDRTRFYTELCFMSPGRQIALDAAHLRVGKLEGSEAVVP